MDSVLDMGSRRMLGFALGEHHDAQLAYGALAMAVAVRGGQVPGVLLHTDQGSEYTATSFRQACGRLGVTQSMGRPGSALDNAVIESWHSTLEWELRRDQHFATQAQARAAVAAWIEDYNTHPQALRAGHAQPRRLRARPGSPGGCLNARFPLLQDRPVLGPVKVVPPRALTALRGLHLDSACAPALHGSYGSGTKASSAQLEVSTLSGEPRPPEPIPP